MTGMVWLGRHRERAVLKICDKHINKVLDVVDALSEEISAFVKGDVAAVKAAYEKLFKLEREADDIKEDILGELSRGPLHPIDREDIIRLVLTSDDVAAYAKTAGRKLLLVDPSWVPQDIKDGLAKMMEKTVECVSRLKITFDRLIEDPKGAIKEAELVERLEEEIDEIRMDLTTRIVGWAEEVKAVRWIMVKEVVESIETVSDRAEDTADVIRSLAILS